MRPRGQSLLESTVLILAATAALLVMFAFIRSAMSYRFKSGADGIGHGMLYRR